ncbi:oligosaccharide flippase family protein [Nocardia sp. NPDC005978]|uniref:oligosaccharide flippase family protein n=1 Tax=Nocardia sp. NPDC005978 TaxID=3156725 RepID=UPI0033ABC3E4
MGSFGLPPPQSPPLDPGGAGAGAGEPPPGKSLTGKIGRVAAASAGALIFGELVSLGQTVALARLLSPAEVGAFAAGTVLTMLLTTFVEGGLRSGLVQREKEVADAADTVFRASLLNGLVVGLFALAAAPVIGTVFHDETIGLIAAATSGFLLLFALTNVPEALLQREFSVRRRIIVGPAVSVSFCAVSVTLAALGFGVWSLVIGTYASYAVWVLAVWWLARWRPGRGRASMRIWRELARFGSPVVVNMLGSRVQTTVEAAVVGRGLSAAALGHYRYGQRIAQIPVRFIVEVGAFSLFPAFSRIAEERDARRLAAAYLRAIRLTTAGAAALCGLIVAVGEPAVVIVFGERWREAGLVVVAMAGLGLGKAWMSVSEEAIKGAGRTALLNWQTAIELVLGIGLLLVLVRLYGLIGVGLATSATALVVGVVVIGLARNVIGVRIGDLIRAIGPPLPAAGLALAATWLLEHRVLQADTRPLLTGIGALLLDAVVFVIIYALVLCALAPEAPRAVLRLAAARTGRRNGASPDAISVGAEPLASREPN